MSGKILVEMPIPEICHIIMNRPEKHNALDREAYRLLTDALQNADENENIRVIVLSGAGKCFTAGNDLHDFTGESLLDGKGQSPGLKLLLTLHGMNKPVIAAVEGYAVGIGATMLNHCDLAYCGTSARFRFPFATLGLSPEGGSTFYLPLAAGYKKAAELLFFGDFFSAEDALQFHLLNAIVEDNNAVSYALQKAEKLAKMPFQSILATKKMLKKRNKDKLVSILEEEAKTFHNLRMSAETQKIIKGFFNK
ncbi:MULTISPECIES: enoyl-CoA hydratase/isomerase family protein [Bartonella]|uniref:enoyl-CoA hydratase/isomerase family protein n=1 Tax=Bartonella TaxID=773 RepID=UPI0018DE4686|nr:MULTISPECIES: enoyl-CoA hydratase-related protein [Bartonella]MBH9974389.1 enoyl-CoA hydratase/isomerase family protein [Bartonella choladocola]MBI0013996.1 enoyl-CoA hydratase/isomerase family protein [Bartonella sp. B10834G3]